MKRFSRWLTLFGIVLLHTTVLWRYGTTLPPLTPPEEVNLANLAHNIAAGHGLVTTVASEFFPFPNRPQPFYMPVVTYALALSNWGTIWGFDPAALRWFNRLLSALTLVLLFVLACRWRISRRMALFAVLWTALDIPYQFSHNVIRADPFNAFWFLLGLWSFTKAEEEGGLGWWTFSGLCLAVALFAHFWLAMYGVIWLALVVLLRRQVRPPVAFATPLAVAGVGWAAYVALDWESFQAVAQLAVRDKTDLPPLTTVFALLGLNDLQPFLGVYPSNAPVWLAPLVAITWSRFRGEPTIKWWQVGLLWIAYFLGHGNLFPWYLGWFAPFGYLAAAWLGDRVIQRSSNKHVAYSLLLLSVIWAGYQFKAVWSCWQAVPDLHRDQMAFLQDLEAELLPHTAVWLFTVPDASFALQRQRPDVEIYVGTGYFAPRFDFNKRVQAMIFVDSWVDQTFLPPHRVKRKWHLQAILDDYTVVWVEVSTGN